MNGRSSKPWYIQGVDIHFREPARQFGALIDQIRRETATLSRIGDNDLRRRLGEIRSRVQDGASLLSTDILVPTFSLVCETFGREQNLRPFDVQLLAGIVMARGAIAEMQTGEGKTIAAVAPAVLHSLTRKSVHIATVNSYLAGRDFDSLRPVYQRLGLTVGLLRSDASPSEKRHAYRCDITYGPGYEYGFDYLRDQLSLWQQPTVPLGNAFRSRLHGRQPQPVLAMQRGHYFTIVDEIDSVLIDEANVPLVLSNSMESEHDRRSESAFRTADELAESMIEGTHFQLDSTTKTASLTEAGRQTANGRWQRAAKILIDRPWTNYVEKALQARHLLKRDIDYVVLEGQIQIIDPNTGRIFPDRTWRDGLHEAVEAKERIALSRPKQSVARISRQRYYRLYRHLAGMTGTARESSREFQQTFRLAVVPIPLRKQSQRCVYQPRHFDNRQAKWRAILDEISTVHQTGRPVLVGTRNIANSETISRCLDQIGIPHLLLNGIQDESEADIIRKAGGLFAVTIATNMAGRGTDIKLSAESKQCGGLHVIVEEPHSSSRVDRQLIGRAARQGDPGSCRIFVCQEDDLISGYAQRFDWIRRLASPKARAKDTDGRVRRAQRRADQTHQRQRLELLRHDRWLEETLDIASRTHRKNTM